MNAMDVLKKQHREIQRLFERLDEAGPDEAQALFAQLADALAVHVSIETEYFIPAVRRADGDELLADSLGDTGPIRRLVRALLEIPLDDPAFAPKLRTLAEEVESHIDEQESELMPEAEHLFGADELEELGEEMEQSAADLTDEGEPRLHLPVDATAPL